MNLVILGVPVSWPGLLAGPEGLAVRFDKLQLARGIKCQLRSGRRSAGARRPDGSVLGIICCEIAVRLHNRGRVLCEILSNEVQAPDEPGVLGVDAKITVGLEDQIMIARGRGILCAALELEFASQRKNARRRLGGPRSGAPEQCCGR